MKCQNCGAEMAQEESYELGGEWFCEDCYMEIFHPLPVGDCYADLATRMIRERLGQSGTEGLSELQKGIYDFIKERGKVTPEEVARQFNLTLSEMQRQYAVLKWCGLTRGYLEAGKIYLSPKS